MACVGLAEVQLSDCSLTTRLQPLPEIGGVCKTLRLLDLFDPLQQRFELSFLLSKFFQRDPIPHSCFGGLSSFAWGRRKPECRKVLDFAADVSEI